METGKAEETYDALSRTLERKGLSETITIAVTLDDKQAAARFGPRPGMVFIYPDSRTMYEHVSHVVEKLPRD